MSIEMWDPGTQKFDSIAVHVMRVGCDQSYRSRDQTLGRAVPSVTSADVSSTQCT